MHALVDFFWLGRVQHSMKCHGIPLALVISTLLVARSQAQSDFQKELKDSGFKIAYESYVDNNWEIFVMNADGSHPQNLTRTPDLHEHYPQISPDGRRICFSVDQGEGREAVRS